MLNNWLAAHGLRSVFVTSSVVVATCEPESLTTHVPQLFELDKFEGRPVVATAFVESRSLRPAFAKGTDKGLRLDLIETLVFCSYTDSIGRTLRGFYLLNSAVSKRWAEIGARVASPYRPNSLRMSIDHDDLGTSVTSGARTLARFERFDSPAASAAFGPFGQLSVAEPFMRPRSFNFVVRGTDVFVMQGVLKHWKPEPVRVSAFDSAESGLEIASPELLGFQVRDVPYLLRLGRVDQATTNNDLPC